MKKVILAALVAVLSVAFAITPALASIPTAVTVTTTSLGPVINAQWEQRFDGNPLDDSPVADSQFLPSGQYDVDTCVALFAVVSDPEGISDVDMVWADLQWPAWQGWCNDPVEEIQLSKMPYYHWTSVGLDVFNAAYQAGLVTFGSGYSYAQVAEAIQQDSARVFVGAECFSYCDPAGIYSVNYVGQDKSGAQGSMVGQFEFLQWSGIEVDFTSVDYTPVKINTWKQVDGDMLWNSPAGVDNSGTPATVRNVGNVACTVQIMQDDMGFGTRESFGRILSNVHYYARLGNAAGDKVTYDPGQWVTIPGVIPLCCEAQKLDLGIYVEKLPGGKVSYTGNVYLDTTGVAFTPCTETVG